MGRRAGGLLLALALAAACSSGSGAADQAIGGGTDGGNGAGGDATSATTPTTPAPRSFTLAASGDILAHDPVQDSALGYGGGSTYDFRPMFDDVRDVLSAADWAICHQETPIAGPDNTSLSGYPIFNVPHEIAAGLKDAGFDACDTASNHALDRGFTGLTATLDALDEAGLGHVGTSRTPEESAHPPIYVVNGVRVGHLAYTLHFNGLPVPVEAPWLGGVVWPEVGEAKVLADAAALKARGAEVVVLSMHWGNEYQQEPTADQRALAQTLLVSPDVDLIIGAHAHVVQPCEKLAGEYVQYGMGNFLSNQRPDRGLATETQDGVIVQFRFDEVAPGRFTASEMRFTPTHVALDPHRVERATPEQHPESYQRTVEAVTALGPAACDAIPT